MSTMDLYKNVQEIAQNKTPNSVVFGILQLNNQIEYALKEGMSANVIDEVLRDALNSCGKIYL